MSGKINPIGCSIVKAVRVSLDALMARPIIALAGLSMFAALSQSVPVNAGMAGALDPSFGSGGKVITDIGSGSHDNTFTVGIAPGGKPVVIGNSDANGSADFAILRYNKNGTLDTTFGSGGKVLTDFGSGSDDFAFGGLVEPNGKIIAVGGSNVDDSSFDFAIARYNKDGSLDSSFGTGGKVQTDFGSGHQSDDAGAVALAPGGKIVVVGGTAPSSNDFAIARYNKDGSLDPSFGTGGKVVTDLGGSVEFASAVAIQHDGKIVVVGTSNASDSTKRDFAIARYNKDGSLDSSFGTGGSVLTDFGSDSSDSASSLVLAPHGKIVVAGTSDAADPNFDFGLARYDKHGNPDTSFGTGGKVLTDLGSGSNDQLNQIALQPRNKIIAVGVSDAQNVNGDSVLARYNSDGSLDTTFGTGGKVLTNWGGPSAARAIAIRGNKAVVDGGTAALDPHNDITVARYLLH